jgi:hypothetical protein
LYCYGNQLTSLNVSDNNALTNFGCSNNLLTSLNVKNGKNNQMNFDATANPNLSCIEVDDVIYSTLSWSNKVPLSAYFSGNCGSTSIDNTAIDKALMVYPNPTTGILFVTQKENLTLSDLSGKLLLEQKNTNQLDMSSLPAGMYLLSFGDHLKQPFKIIKD